MLILNLNRAVITNVTDTCWSLQKLGVVMDMEGREKGERDIKFAKTHEMESTKELQLWRPSKISKKISRSFPELFTQGGGRMHVRLHSLNV